MKAVIVCYKLLGIAFVPIALFVRMRSLDDCKVAVRSHKADFLSENER